jgi:hypothetical protein
LQASVQPGRTARHFPTIGERRFVMSCSTNWARQPDR